MSGVPMRAAGPGRRNACAVCKIQRRGCKIDCTFAPYFPADEPFKAEAVRRKFGFTKVERIMKEQIQDERLRDDFMNSIIWESLCRVQHPVQGSVAVILHFLSQIERAEQERQQLQAMLSSLR